MYKLILTFLLLTTISHAQKTGYIKYIIDVEAVDTSRDVRQSVMLLRDSKMELFFTPSQLRIDYHMGQLYNSTTIMDKKQQKMLSLTTNYYGKFANLMDESQGTPLDIYDSTEVITVHREKKKTILGYSCYMVQSTSSKGEVEYWCTDEIKPEVKNLPIVNPSIPGFPLKFSKIENGILMIYQAGNFRTEIDNPESVFSLEIPEGYTVLTSD